MAKMTIEKILEAGGKVKTETNGNPDPVLHITASKALTLGAHAFDLVVTDEAGKESVPLRVVVTVVDAERPNALVAVLNEQNVPLKNNEVPNKTNFVLDAQKSFDPDGGNITSYVWQYIGTNIR
ncbi:MAG: hypothetical protein L6365_05660 [Desulfobulbaceae bacterium]|nr:hypothetical protein [Pseudomonadota bacterium]MCG2746999.1 hypothetical protein [Desulfobulbaceae bacterium]